jgi:hypothetical protein
MTRLRSFAASARQAPRRRFAASARLALLTAALLIGGRSTAFACPVCFGAEETSMIDATRLGILALLVITVVVQGGFVAFFLYLRRRAQRIADDDLENEWSELQGASRT